MGRDLNNDDDCSAYEYKKTLDEVITYLECGTLT